jgi:hypothetical protein
LDVKIIEQKMHGIHGIKMPHCYFHWIVSFQKQRKMRGASSGNKTVWKYTTPPMGKGRVVDASGGYTKQQQ